MAPNLRHLLALLLSLFLAGVAVAANTDRYGDPLPAGAGARLGTSRLRHGGAITSITFAADGKKFATTSVDRTISVWEAATGRELLRCRDFDREPRAAAFTKDGKALICVADGKVRVFEIGSAKDVSTAEPKELRHFSLNTDKLAVAAFSGDASWLAVADENGKVGLWDVNEGKRLTKFIPEGGVRCLAVSKKAKRLATTTGINGIQTWDATSGNQEKSFGKGAYSVLAFSPDGRQLGAGNYDNEVLLFDSAKGTVLSKVVGGKEAWPQSKNGIAGLAFSADSSWLASGAGDGTAHVWELGHGTATPLKRILAGHMERVTAVAFSPDGKRFVTGANNALHVFDTNTWNELPLQARSALQAPLAGLALSPNGKTIVTLDAPLGRLALWEGHTGREIKPPAELPRQAAGAAFTPDGETLAVAMNGQEIGLWDLRTWKLRDRWKPTDLEGDKAVIHTPPSMVYDAGGKRLAVSSGQGLYITVYDKGGKRVAQFIASGGRRARSLSLSPDGSTLASAGTEALVRLWDVDHNKEKATLYGHSGGTLVAVFSPSGHTVATGGKDRMIRLWEVATGKQQRAFGGQPGWVRAVAFAPDGLVLATGNTDGMVRLWDLTTGKLLREFSGHRGAVTRLAFSAKGDILASASVDTTVLVWDTAKLLKERKPAVVTLTPKQLERAWEQLASSDAGTASAAQQTLARAPAQTLPLLRKNVQPLKVERLVQLLHDLDSDTFSVREAAAKELAVAGKFAEPTLKQTLKDEHSAEVRRSVEALLERLRDHGRSPEELRLLRSVEVLELIGNAAAKKILTRIAKEGAKEAELTRQAKTALEHLAKRVP